MERVLSISQLPIRSQRDGISQLPLRSQRDGLATILSTFELRLGSLFRCGHPRMGWPITRDGQTYRACLKCGMRRSFDPETWKSFGSFYLRD
jgi:hypothetical protein